MMLVRLASRAEEGRARESEWIFLEGIASAVVVVGI